MNADLLQYCKKFLCNAFPADLAVPAAVFRMRLLAAWLLSALSAGRYLHKVAKCYRVPRAARIGRKEFTK